MPIEVESPEELGYGTIACNLAESSVADASLDDLEVDLRGLLLRYGDHRGLPELRELIAADGGRPLPPDATPLTPADVLVTTGAAGALFIVATALLDPGDELVVVRPNYATNLETPRAIGAELRVLDLRPEEGWATDPDALAALMTPRTRLVSITNPHNPTGALIPEAALRRIVELVEAHPVARLLVDETYREMTYGDLLPPAATLSPRVIGVSGMSKTYGLPGIRTGWLATRDADLLTTFLAAKEQIQITGSLVDEAIAARALERRPELLPAIRAADRDGARDDARLAGDRAATRLGRAARRRGGLPVDPGRGRHRPGRLPRRPRRPSRDRRGTRPLVRAAALLLPPRLRLAAPGGAGRRAGPDLARPRRGAGTDG